MRLFLMPFGMSIFFCSIFGEDFAPSLSPYALFPHTYIYTHLPIAYQCHQNRQAFLHQSHEYERPFTCNCLLNAGQVRKWHSPSKVNSLYPSLSQGSHRPKTSKLKLCPIFSLTPAHRVQQTPEAARVNFLKNKGFTDEVGLINEAVPPTLPRRMDCRIYEKTHIHMCAYGTYTKGDC